MNHILFMCDNNMQVGGKASCSWMNTGRLRSLEICKFIVLQIASAQLYLKRIRLLEMNNECSMN